MFSSKLFRSIHVITDKEWKQIHKFLLYSKGENSDVLKLYQFIEGNRKNLQHQKLELERVNETLFPGRTRKFILNLMSELQALIVRFWTIQEINTEEDLKSMLNYQALRKRGLFKDADRIEQKLSTRNRNKNILDLWTAFYSMRTKHLQFFSNSENSKDIKKSRQMLEDLVLTLHQIFSNIAQYILTEIVNREHLHSENWIDIKTNLKRVIQVQNHPLSESLKLLQEMLDKEYEEEPLQLGAILKNNQLKISDDLLLTFYYRIRKYYIIQIRQGNMTIKDKLKDLIIWGMEHTTVLENYNVNEFRILSEINILLNLSEIGTAKEYYRQNQKFIISKRKDDIDAIVQMDILFFEKEYDKVIDIYLKTSFILPTNKARSVRNYLKASYEIGEDFEYLLRISRNANELVLRYKDSLSGMFPLYKNFIKIYQKLLLKKYDEVNQFIVSNEPLFERLWFIEKVSNKI